MNRTITIFALGVLTGCIVNVVNVVMDDVIDRARSRESRFTQGCVDIAGRLRATRQLGGYDSQQAELESEYKSVCGPYGPEL